MVRRGQVALPPAYHIMRELLLFLLRCLLCCQESHPPSQCQVNPPPDSLHGLNQHVVQGLKCVGTDLSEAFVTLERRRNRRKRRLTFDLQAAFD